MAGTGAVGTSAAHLAVEVTRFLGHSKPADGPLRDDDQWFYHLTENLAGGLARGTPLVSSAANTVANAARTGILGGMNPGQLAAQSHAAGMSGGGYGQHITIPVYVGSKQVAEVVYDTLKGTLQQNGMSRSMR
jgi:hypothetical protein